MPQGVTSGLAAAEPAVPVEIEPLERARVLVVDDDPRNLLAIRTVVEEVADVVTADSGEEALRQLLRGEFAVILLDVFMPGMDGYETAQIIRSREQTKRIPIVFLSAVNKEAEHLIRGYSMGAVDYVFKPVEPIVLQSKVAVFVDLFSMNKEIQRKARQEQALLDANLRANAERLRAEQELRMAQQRQAAIIESLPIVLYLEPLDRSPRWPAFVSGNFEAVTGFPLSHVAENQNIWADRIHPEDRDRVLGALDRRKDKGIFAVEYRWQCASGDYKHFLDTSVLLRDHAGEPLEWAGTLMDVTDRKLLETQLVHARKMDAIGQLTGGIAHDFNNLLAAVLGGLGLIERRVELDRNQQKILAMTRHAAEQGSELVSRLLAFARRQNLEPARIEPARLSENVRELLAHTLGGLVELDWQRDESLWCLYADEAQLELALMNLIINARDAMPDGGTISVRGANRSLKNDGGLGLKPGDYIVLAVEDEGSGISPDILEQVMEPFFTTKDVGKGTGLGLSMVYGFAKQSGGAISIRSQVGKGTRVEIWLPRAPEISAAAPAGAPALAAPGLNSRSLAIILVDDHEGVRATTAAMLEDLGHRVVEAGDGRELLDRLPDHIDACDLLVTDYAMPVISGADIIRRVRELRPELPAIIITGYADAESIGSRPDDVIVIPKPFTPEQIAGAIATVTADGKSATPVVQPGAAAA
jgi:PAS domain S-box-containing protein